LNTKNLKEQAIENKKKDKMELQGLYDIYLIHDNGGTPFEVLVNEDKNHLLVRLYDIDQSYESGTIHPSKPILDVIYSRIFLGGKLSDELLKQYRFEWGNSILIQLVDDKYIYVGSQIYEFTSKNPILEYFSPIGNNDVPYPFARSANETYLMIENVIIDNTILTQEQEKYPEYAHCPYSLYYNYGYGWVYMKRLPILGKINYRIIHERI
jgi:hypothetical protein